jgi:predicted GIY-YIG superfamily endonuclease
MTTIYCLCDDETIYYVGRTVDVKRRRREHALKRLPGCAADLIPAKVVWRMEILEVVDPTDAVMAERFYCEYLEPTLNKRLPGRDAREYNRVWQQKNKDKVNAKAQRYRDKKRLSQTSE